MLNVSVYTPAATLLPVFEAPAWVMKALLGVLAIGFFVALVFAWVFELTPAGLKRDAEVPPEAMNLYRELVRRMGDEAMAPVEEQDRRRHRDGHAQVAA